MISTKKYYRLKWIAVAETILYFSFLWYGTIRGDAITFPEVAVISLMMMAGIAGFPLFCYLLVKCMYFTKDYPKHLAKMLGIALLSEIPYDLLQFYHQPFTVSHWLSKQNPCFSLVLGFLYLMVSDSIRSYVNISGKAGTKANSFFKLILQLLNLALFIAIALVTKSDNGYPCIILFAFFHAMEKTRYLKFPVIAGIASYIFLHNASYLLCLIDIFLILRAEKFEYQPNQDAVSKSVKFWGAFFIPVFVILLSAILTMIT